MFQTNAKTILKLPPMLGFIGLGILIFCLTFVISLQIPAAADYWYAFEPSVQRLLTGANLYDSSRADLFYPPWLIWALAPGGYLPDMADLALLRAVSVCIIVYALVYVVGQLRLEGYRRLWAFALSLLNFHQVDLLLRGQIDALGLLGVILVLQRRHWLLTGAGYVLMSTKPPNLAILALILLWLESRETGWRESLKSLLVPFGVFILSLFLHGFWFLTLISNLQTNTPYEEWRTTIWRALAVLGIPGWLVLMVCIGFVVGGGLLWRYARSKIEQVALALSLIFVVTFYAVSYHYIALLVFIIPVLLRYNWWAAFGLYALTYLPILRLFVGISNSWLDWFFPVAGFGLLAFVLLKRKRHNAKTL
jgi:hypothetical protein